tara:strand:+ start:8751 stop:9086 length:336 start_codon:yes stop_codon:yes gene_type:complete
MNPDKIWSSVIGLGDTFASRTGKKYTVTDIRDDGGFTITRASTDKAVRISGRMLGRMLTRIGDGESFAYQANATKGGISYTVAIEAGVVYALRDLLTQDDANRRYVVGGAQ